MRARYGTLAIEEAAGRAAMGRPAPNLQHAVATFPEVAYLQYRYVKKAEAELPFDVRVLGVMAHAARVQNAYCWGHYVPLMLRLGYDPDVVVELRNGELRHLSARDQAVVRFVQAVEDFKVDDQLYAEARHFLGPTVTSALVIVAGQYAAISRIQAAYDVPQDDGFGGLEEPF